MLEKGRAPVSEEEKKKRVKAPEGLKPSHDAYTDLMMAQKTRRPLEVNYNDEESGVLKEPGGYVKIDDVGVEGADPESLLTAEAEGGQDALDEMDLAVGKKERQRTKQEIKILGKEDNAARAGRRAMEKKAGWSPEKTSKEGTIFVYPEDEKEEAASGIENVIRKKKETEEDEQFAGLVAKAGERRRKSWQEVEKKIKGDLRRLCADREKRLLRKLKQLESRSHFYGHNYQDEQNLRDELRVVKEIGSKIETSPDEASRFFGGPSLLKIMQDEFESSNPAVLADFRQHYQKKDILEAKKEKQKEKGRLEYVLDRAAQAFEKATRVEPVGTEEELSSAERQAAWKEVEERIKEAVQIAGSSEEIKSKARFAAAFLSYSDTKRFIKEVAREMGREEKKRKQLRRELNADLSGQDKPVAKNELPEEGEGLAQKEKIAMSSISHGNELIRGYDRRIYEDGRLVETKFARHRREGREKTKMRGRREKVASVLDMRMEAGGERGAIENAASQRLKDFFDVQRDHLGDSNMSEEELLRHGRFTALDFFDFVDDIKDAPNFSALVEVAGRELRARLQRDSDLAEHFLHMIKRNEAEREIIPHFEDLERIAQESVLKPLTYQERDNLEKRYRLVVKEKKVAEAQKGWDEEELSRQAYFDRVGARSKEAYKYQPEKDAAQEYFRNNRKAKAQERQQTIEEESADVVSFQQDKGLVRRLLDLLRNRKGGSYERSKQPPGESGRPPKVPRYKTKRRPSPENRSNP